MRRQAIIFWLLLLLLPVYAFAQQSDLGLLVQKIKVDYPGYKEKTKGINFDQFVANTISANRNDTFKAMAIIVDFFHDRHLDLQREKDSLDRKTCIKNFLEVTRHFHSKKTFKQYEGYWLNEYANCVLAIKQTGRNPLRYMGYVIECRDSNILYPGMIFAEMELIKASIYFTLTHASKSRRAFYVHSEFRNDSVMTMGPFHKWKRLRNYVAPIIPQLSSPSDTAKGQWLDSNNYLITIPSSTIRNGMIVDSLINAIPQLKTRVKNLIVDVRNNTGGTIRAFSSLLPLIYTNPILKVNSSVYCTEDESKKTEKEIADYIKTGNIDSQYLSSIKDLAKILRDSSGKFLRLPQDTLKLDTIYTFPQNVAFIMNYGCQSATEIALLDARQSKKVTFFGEHTQGAIDYLDYYPQTLPSEKYKLYIATTRREIPPGQEKLDGKGIAPDILIEDKEKDWVQFVKRYYENR